MPRIRAQSYASQLKPQDNGEQQSKLLRVREKKVKSQTRKPRQVKSKTSKIRPKHRRVNIAEMEHVNRLFTPKDSLSHHLEQPKVPEFHHKETNQPKRPQPVTATSSFHSSSNSYPSLPEFSTFSPRGFGSAANLAKSSPVLPQVSFTPRFDFHSSEPVVQANWFDGPNATYSNSISVIQQSPVNSNGNPVSSLQCSELNDANNNYIVEQQSKNNNLFNQIDKIVQVEEYMQIVEQITSLLERKKAIEQEFDKMDKSCVKQLLQKYYSENRLNSQPPITSGMQMLATIAGDRNVANDPRLQEDHHQSAGNFPGQQVYHLNTSAYWSPPSEYQQQKESATQEELEKSSPDSANYPILRKSITTVAPLPIDQHIQNNTVSSCNAKPSFSMDSILGNWSQHSQYDTNSNGYIYRHI